MKRVIPFPVLWLLLVAMWLVLHDTVSLGQAVIGALVALAGVLGLAALQMPLTRLRALPTAAALTWLVLIDIVQSNIDVARIVMRPGTPRCTPAFLDIPLTLRNPAGLAALACIITSTPGTAWAGYDAESGVLTMHVLDLVDADAMRHTIRERYERRLMEIFQ
jgi:multicomponent K+:H+ antiporter subunit E